MFYLGSCRYMYDFYWNFFPARLHTTKEVLFFLQNIYNLPQIINALPNDLVNCVFGDIFEPSVAHLSLMFLNSSINKNIDKIIIEISSLKIRYYNGIPINNFYYEFYKPDYNLQKIYLTDDEVEEDIIKIKNLCKQIWNEEIEIHIIPHFNLKIIRTDDYIHSRKKLVELLENLSQKHDLYFHDIGKYIETNIDENARLEHYMSDYLHYNHGFEVIKEYLKKDIAYEL